MKANKTFFEVQMNEAKRYQDFSNRIFQAEVNAGNGVALQQAEGELMIARQMADEQLKLIRERLRAIPQGAMAERQELIAQEREIIASVFQASKKVFDAEVQIWQTYQQQALSFLEGQMSRGHITEVEHNERRLNVMSVILDEELALIQRRRKEIGDKDINLQYELAEKEAQLHKRRYDAQKQFLDSQISELDKYLSEAKDAITLSTKEREIAVAKLLNAGLLNSQEIEQEKLKSSRIRIEEELKLELEKLEILSSASNFGNSKLDRENRQRLRASRLRIADLQLQLLQNERQEQGLLTKAIDRVIRAVENKGKAAEVSLTKELRLVDILNKSLDLQNKILTARKNLSNAKTSYLDAEFKVLEATAKSEREKKDLAEIQANLKLQAVRTQIDLDRQSLELQIQQTNAAQRRLEIENQIALIKNRVQIAKAELNEQKIQAKPGATPEEIQSAKLDTLAAKVERGGLLEQREFLNQQKGINQQLAQFQRRTFELNSQSKLTAAELESAQNIRSRSARREKLQDLRERTQRRVIGVSQSDDPVGYNQRVEGFLRRNRGYRTTPLQDYFGRQLENRLTPKPPKIETAHTPVLTELQDSTAKFDTAVDKLVRMVNTRLNSPVEQTNQINNYFQSGEAQKAAQDTTQAIRKELVEIAKQL